MTESRMTYDQWFDTFKPIKNHIDKTSSFNGCMFETYGPERDAVKSHAINKIWTFIECDGVMLISPGYHLVNRQGYFVTEVPWTDVNLEIELWNDSDLESEEVANA